MLVARRGGDVVMPHLPSKNQHIFHSLHAQKTFSLEDVGQCVDDITQHKHVEEELFKLAAIVESSDDAIFSETLDGIVLSWNSGAERLYGYSALEMIGQSIHTLVPPERREEWEETMQRLEGGQRIEHFETVRNRKDGRRIDVSITVSPVRNASG